LRTFLAQIDFFTYFFNADLSRPAARAVVEAMAAGCVVILPTSLRTAFSSGAVYCEPAHVRDVVNEFYADWKSYRIQSQHAAHFAQANYDSKGYLSRLAKLGAI
jgi:hypothetical protein